MLGRGNLGDALAEDRQTAAAQAQFSLAEGLFKQLLDQDPNAPRLVEKLASVQAKILPKAPDPL